MPLDADFWKREDEELEVMLVVVLFEAAWSGGRIKESLVDPAKMQAELVGFAKTQAKLLAEQINKNSKESIEKGRKAGFPFEEIFKKIFGENRAQIVATTETVRSFAQGLRVALGKQRWQWHTAHDELVCVICSPLNNEIRDEGEVFVDDPELGYIEHEPAHPNCRCITTPYVE